jgi:hypothetical protein
MIRAGRVRRQSGRSARPSGNGLLADDYQVTVGDCGTGHGITFDLEHEQIPVSDKPPGQPEYVLGQFHSVQRDASWDLPDQRDLDPLKIGPRPGISGLNDRARLPSASAQSTSALQDRQVVADRGHGQPDFLADLAQARRMALVARKLPDKPHDHAASPVPSAGTPGMV